VPSAVSSRCDPCRKAGHSPASLGWGGVGGFGLWGLWWQNVCADWGLSPPGVVGASGMVAGAGRGLEGATREPMIEVDGKEEVEPDA